MKKFIASVITALVLCTSIPVSASATAPLYPITAPAKATKDSLQARILLQRLDEINALDKSTLSAREKKQLRKETRSIKKQLKAISGGVYLSSGAIILILILLLIFV